MKHLRYHLVDPISGIAINPRGDAPNGRTHPSLAGLAVEFFFSELDQIFLATCDDVAIDPSSGIDVLTLNEYNAIVTEGFGILKAKVKAQIYAKAAEVTASTVTAYHSSEISFAVAVKLPQAHAAVAAANDIAANAAAPYLYAEATVRGISTKELAALVIAKYNELHTAEAQVAGVRGAKTDDLDVITLDVNNPMVAFNAVHAIAQNINVGWI